MLPRHVICPSPARHLPLPGMSFAPPRHFICRSPASHLPLPGTSFRPPRHLIWPSPAPHLPLPGTCKIHTDEAFTISKTRKTRAFASLEASEASSLRCVRTGPTRPHSIVRNWTPQDPPGHIKYVQMSLPKPPGHVKHVLSQASRPRRPQVLGGW